MYNLFDPQVIRVYKGNSLDISIVINDTETDEFVIIEDGDTVLFTVKNANVETVIKKQLTSLDISEDDGHSLNLALSPADTMLVTGEYKYDVLLVTSDGQAITIISSAFIVEPVSGLITDIGKDDGE